MPNQAPTSAPVQVFIQQNAHLLRSHSTRLGFLQQGKHVAPVSRWKAFEKISNGVTGLQMVEQTLYWDAGPSKDRLGIRTNSSVFILLLLRSTY